MGRVIKYGLGIFVIVAVLASLGDKSVQDLSVGDCFDDPEEGVNTAVLTVPTKACSEPHDNEVYALHSVKGSDWPGGGKLETIARDACYEAFEPYVDRSYEESQLDIGWLTPTEGSWEEEDDRSVTCFLYDMEFSKLTSSMKGSGV